MDIYGKGKITADMTAYHMDVLGVSEVKKKSNREMIFLGVPKILNGKKEEKKGSRATTALFRKN